MKRRVLSLLLALCFALALLPGAAFAADIVASGNCGEDADNDASTVNDSVTWTLDSNGLMTISGQGEMASCFEDLQAPEKVFADKDKVLSIVIEDGVTNIVNYAFFYFENLTSIEIPHSVTTIGVSAFAGCTSLSRIVLPDNLDEIALSAFQDCTGLTSIVIPDSVQGIGQRAFQGCTGLESVIFGSGLAEIQSYTFQDCTSLKRIVIPDNIKRIASSAFQNCTGLESVDIGNGVTWIGGSAFQGCSSMKHLTIGERVSTISNAAFYGCSSLTKVIIPDSVIFLNRGAFSHCTSLRSVSLGSGIKDLSGVFNECTSLTYFVVPEGVTSLSITFYGCTNLVSITLPGSLYSIVSGTFSNCNNLVEVLYTGTEAQLYAMQIQDNNDALLNADVYLVSKAPDPLYYFFDMPSPTGWAYPGISFCLDNGLMYGVNNYEFSPNTPVTRAQLVTILWRQAGEPQPTKACAFTDLTQSWYKTAVAWAAENGIVSGRNATHFDPNASITREEMAAIIYRYAQNFLQVDVSKAADLSTFPDSGKVASYARVNLQWAVAEGLISGNVINKVTCLDPKGTATRAQAATILMNFCENIVPAA